MLNAVVPNLLEFAEHLLIIKNLFRSTIMVCTNSWEHLLVSPWKNEKKIPNTWIFMGALDDSFGNTFGPGSSGWETLA